ncbi:MAG: cytochrome c/FTR1 family iron permease [Oligoflexia bacterium]|nr:cytochrome c/FTR1 family iron permease [Oligoflexia bacterium]
MLKRASFTVWLLFTVCLISPALGAEKSPNAAVLLLDYLAQDYSGAVQNGKIINQAEFDEQVEFAGKVRILVQELGNRELTNLTSAKIEELSSLINQKKSATKVSALALEIKSDIIGLTKIKTAPLRWPEISRGQMLFNNYCVSCHGPQGRGDGVASKGLEPPPTNFHDGQRMEQVAPFQAFNTIRLGLDGTAMTSFGHLPEEDVWALAFYVVSLRHRESIDLAQEDIHELREKILSELSLEDLSSKNDKELSQSLAPLQANTETVLAAARLFSSAENGSAFLSVASRNLRDAYVAYAKNDKDAARHKALIAYLEGVEPVEPRLRAADSELVFKIEEKMAAVRGSIETSKPTPEVKARVDEAQALLLQARDKVRKHKPSAWVTLVAAAGIILREGFESVLIVITLLGVIRASKNRKAEAWVHAGWVAAVSIGVVAWFFSGWLLAMSGAQRELLEGLTALLAVVILLYMGFWLHSRTEITRWRAFVDGQVASALQAGNLFGLASISFIGVFREAFETVLFLRTLWLQSELVSKTALLAGVVGASALLVILAYAMVRYSAKIPIRKLFTLSSALMVILAVMLMGQGLSALQEMGMIPVTVVSGFLRIEILGIHPTVETLAGQLAVILISAILWFLGRQPSIEKQAYSS